MCVGLFLNLSLRWISCRRRQSLALTYFDPGARYNDTTRTCGQRQTVAKRGTQSGVYNTELCEVLAQYLIVLYVGSLSSGSRYAMVCSDQGYGRGGTPILNGVFEPLARVALYPTDEDGLGTWFAAA